MFTGHPAGIPRSPKNTGEKRKLNQDSYKNIVIPKIDLSQLDTKNDCLTDRKKSLNSKSTKTIEMKIQKPKSSNMHVFDGKRLSSA